MSGTIQVTLVQVDRLLALAETQLYRITNSLMLPSSNTRLELNQDKTVKSSIISLLECLASLRVGLLKQL